MPPSERTGEEHPTKRARTDREDPPITGPSGLPVPGHSAAKSGIGDEDMEPGNGHDSNELFTDSFPVSTAGAPIGTQRTKQQDLQKYMEACRRLGDRELFETAEIMMGTGLSGRGRSRHLKAPAVSSSQQKTCRVLMI